MFKRKVTIRSVIWLLIVVATFSFYFGVAFGARWAFKGIIPKPTHYYESTMVLRR